MKTFIATVLVAVAVASTGASANVLRDLAQTNGTFTPHGAFDGR